MPFRYSAAVLQPEDISMLSDVLNRVCPVSSAATNELDRHERAFHLVTLFQAGIHDEATLERVTTEAFLKRAAV